MEELTMTDPDALSPAQRRQAADILCAQVRSWMEDPSTVYHVSVQRGMDARPNLATGQDELHPNGTATLVLHVNGGARHSSSPGVLPVPRVVG
jgi:hypothetical protein